MTSSTIIIEDFQHPTHNWKAKNDPVMGGRSTGTVSIENGLGIFDGEVVDVPFLQSPGFITMETRGGVYPDVSTCQGLEITLRATEPYHGYRVSFGNVHVPGGRFAYGYKANLEAPLNEFDTIYLPFDAFTAKWDDATGDAIVTCHEDAHYCPTRQSLQNLQTLSFWGEGKKGRVHLEIASIAGANCAAADAQNKGDETTLSDSRQTPLGLARTSIIAQDDTLDGRHCAVSLFAVVGLLYVTTKFLAWYRRTRDYATVPDQKLCKGQELTGTCMNV